MNTITILNNNSELINITNVTKVYTYTSKFGNKKLQVVTIEDSESYDFNDIKEYVIS